MSTTDPALLESKNISGIETEKKVIRLLEGRGYLLLEHRWRTLWAEVDLVFWHASKGLVLIEVKGKMGYLSRRQAQALARVLEALFGMGLEKVSLHLAVVSQQGRLSFIPNPLCDLLS